MGNLDQKMSIQPGYVRVERSMDYEVVSHEQPAQLMEMAAFCKMANRRKVLILGSKTKVSLGELDIYDLGKEIAKLNLKIAVAELHDASKEDVKFLETVVWNRGGPIKFFDSEMEAKYWLGL